MAPNKEVSRRLRMARTERDWSQVEVERRARQFYKGFPKGKYWRIENGYDLPTEREQAAIARALRFQAQELFPVEALAS